MDSHHYNIAETSGTAGSGYLLSLPSLKSLE